jgi:hypothetical protein
MRVFVEESEFASGENDDGALILRVYAPPSLCFVFLTNRKIIARGKMRTRACDAK